MVNINNLKCPDCGGNLRHYNKTKRKIKTKGGESFVVEIHRYRCPQCGKIHRAIPDDILPHKHYESEIIFGVLEDLITADTLGYEDYPCEMTMKRWKASPELQFLLRKQTRNGGGSMKKEEQFRICPDCGGKSKYYDQVWRTVRSEYGKKERIQLERYRCLECRKIHRVLPEYLLPYKQFKADIVNGFVEESLNIEDLEYEDFPSEQSIKGWKRSKSKK
jgi:hypothetical protein